MTNLVVLRHVAIVLLAALLASCSRSATPDEQIRIGTNPWPGYEFLYLAREKGYFRDAGLDVKLIQFSSLSDARRSLERGQIDGIASTLVEVVQAAYASDRHPQIVLVTDVSEGADVILVDEDTARAGSLRGRRIGVEAASLGMYMLARALESQNLSLDDVEIHATDQLSMEAEFTRGELDAVVSYPPTSVRLLQSTSATEMYSSRQIPKEIIDVIAIDRSVTAARPDAAEGIVKAFYRAVDYWRRHPDDANAMMGHREGLTADEFAQALSDGIRLVSEQEQREFFGAGGHLSRVVPRVEATLRQTGQITGPATTKSLLDSSPTSAP